MANVTYFNHTTAASAAGTDYVPIWATGASAPRKVLVSNLLGGTMTGGGVLATGGFTLTVAASGTVALLDVAQTHTAAETFTQVNIGTSGGATAITKPADGHTLMSLDSVVLTAGAKFTFPPTGGLLVLYSSSAGRSAVYALTSTTVTAIAQDASGFSTTMGTGSRINVYHNGANFEIENGFATSRTVSWIVIGA